MSLEATVSTTDSIAAEEVPQTSKTSGGGVAKVPVGEDSSEGITPTESDFLSDKEWETLSKKKRRVKLGDAEHEMTLAEIEKNTGLNKSITEKAQMTAKEKAWIDGERQKITNLFEELKNDPEAVFNLARELGHDPDALAVQRAYSKMKYDQMSAEQKEALADKQRADQAERRLKEIDARDEQAQMRTHEEKVFEETKQDIDLALKALGKLGAESNYLNIDRIAQIYQALNNKHGKKPSPEEVAQIVRRKFDQDIEGYFSHTDIKTLISRLPKTKLNELRKELLEMEAPSLPHGSSQMGSNPEAPVRAKKSIGIDDWLKSLK